MAMRAYVLAETGVGKTKDVLNALSGIPGIKSADACTGPYDVIFILEADDFEGIGNLVTQLRAHAAGGIIRTTTCLVVELS